MTPAHLSRLRPQISALSSQFEDVDAFIKSLTAFLRSYSSDIDIASLGIAPHSLIPKLNIPAVVINQLEISFNHLAKIYPDQSIEIAECLWKRDHFEYKQIALLLLINLPDQLLDIYFDKLEVWVDKEIETPIINIILESAKTNHAISTHYRWSETINSWLINSNTRIKRFGLEAMADFIQGNPSHPFPEIKVILSPIFSKPEVSINSELLKIINALTSNSINETAAFLISLSINYPNNDMYSFIRKCLPFFPEYLVDEIKETMPK